MPQTWLANPLVEKLLLLAAGTALGYLSSYLLDRRKAKREPHRRLSWDASIQRALIEVSKNIKTKVSFVYGGTEVENLTHIRCTVTNTGNRVVKDHELRFSFPADVQMLENYLDPAPEPELGVDQIEDSSQQCRYRIAHLERDESVVFNFVTAGGTLGDWQPRSFNKEGDVEFQRREVSATKDDQEHLFPFVTLLLLLLTAPSALRALDIAIGGVATLAISIAVLGLLLRHVRPVVRLVERLFTRSHAQHQSSNFITGTTKGGLFIQTSTIHDLRVIPSEGDGTANEARVDGRKFEVPEDEGSTAERKS